MKLYVDIWSGLLYDAPGGRTVSIVQLFLRDIVQLDIGFVDDGEAVTGTILDGGNLLKVGIKAQAGGATLLALADDYTIVGDAAQVILDLNTTEAQAYFTDNVPDGADSCTVRFEIQVTKADESQRQTYYQGNCLFCAPVNTEDDTDPIDVDLSIYVLKSSLFDADGNGISNRFANVRFELNQLVGGVAGCLDFVPTIALTADRTVFLTNIGGSVKTWVLTTTAAAADGQWIIQPVDYDAVHNQKQWVQGA